MDFYFGLAQVIGIHTLLGFSAWCVLQTGQVSMLQGGFFAIGAYSAGMLTTMWQWPILPRIACWWPVSRHCGCDRWLPCPARKGFNAGGRDDGVR